VLNSLYVMINPCHVRVLPRTLGGTTGRCTFELATSGYRETRQPAVRERPSANQEYVSLIVATQVVAL
jgi:hypothetical protein